MFDRLSRRTTLTMLVAVAMLNGAALPTLSAHAADLDPQNTLVLTLKTGKVTIKLRPDVAPGHVERVKQLVKEKFYDGIVFHRVIPDFMAQTGDPTGTGTGGSKYPDLKAEFSSVQFGRGTIGAARTANPDSANSQFFICFSKGCAHLTGQYTVWGEIVEGMEQIDLVAKGEPPATPDKIVNLRLAAEPN
jgi:cyclophilin family peptidyl-prolyl cis-trans isomerase